MDRSFVESRRAAIVLLKQSHRVRLARCGAAEQQRQSSPAGPLRPDCAGRRWECHRLGDVGGLLLLRIAQPRRPDRAGSYTLELFEQRFSFDFAMRMAPKTGVFSTSSLFPRGPFARGDGV